MNCFRCGKTKTCRFTVDPFEVALIIDNPPKGVKQKPLVERWWCSDCLKIRHREGYKTIGLFARFIKSLAASSDIKIESDSINV